MSGNTTHQEHKTLNKRRRTCIQEAVPDGCAILIHTQREHAEEHQQASTSSRYLRASTRGHPHTTWDQCKLPQNAARRRGCCQKQSSKVPLHTKHSAVGMIASEVGGMERRPLVGHPAVKHILSACSHCIFAACSLVVPVVL